MTKIYFTENLIGKLLHFHTVRVYRHTVWEFKILREISVRPKQKKFVSAEYLTFGRISTSKEVHILLKSKL